MRLAHIAHLVAAIVICCAGGEASAQRVRTPANVAGVYDMVERDGAPIPNRRKAANPQCEIEIIRSVLTLRADGSADESVTSRLWCDGKTEPEPTRTWTMAGGFRLSGPRGDSIVITVSSDAGGTDRMAGQFAGNQLRVVGETIGHSLHRSYRYVRRSRRGTAR